MNVISTESNISATDCLEDNTLNVLAAVDCFHFPMRK